jgi:hypothetical protein
MSVYTVFHPSGCEDASTRDYTYSLLVLDSGLDRIHCVRGPFPVVPSETLECLAEDVAEANTSEVHEEMLTWGINNNLVPLELDNIVNHDVNSNVTQGAEEEFQDATGESDNVVVQSWTATHAALHARTPPTATQKCPCAHLQRCSVECSFNTSTREMYITISITTESNDWDNSDTSASLWSLSLSDKFGCPHANSDIGRQQDDPSSHSSTLEINSEHNLVVK